MNTFTQMQSAVQSDLNVGDNSSLFPLSTIKNKLNRSYIKIASFVRWADLEDAKTTSTQTDQEAYDVHDTWKYNSVWRVVVTDSSGDDVIYGEKPDGSPMDFKDYLEWKADNPSSSLKKWTQYRNQIFLYPTPSVSTSTISAWGQLNVTEMSADSDTTIFSSNMPEVNEAIVLEALGMLQRKGEKEGDGQFASAEAKQITVIAHNKLKLEKAKYEKAQPMLNVPDFFGRSNSNSTIGNFLDLD